MAFTVPTDEDFLRTLKAQRDATASRIEAAKADLKQLEAVLAGIQNLIDMSTTSPGKPKTIFSISSGQSFRDKIRSVVWSAPYREWRPAEVRETLERAGVESPGATDMTSRVATELYKLATETDELIRGDGTYRTNPAFKRYGG